MPLIETLQDFPLPQQQLADGNCVDLPPQVVDRLFWADGVGSEANFARSAAKAICRRCVIREDCRLDAVNRAMADLPQVIGGESRRTIESARSWLMFDLGWRDAAPKYDRPDWLPRSDAAETAEQTLVEAELGVER